MVGRGSVRAGVTRRHDGDASSPAQAELRPNTIRGWSVVPGLSRATPPTRFSRSFWLSFAASFSASELENERDFEQRREYQSLLAERSGVT
jgi:hypothetical protein